MLDLSGLAGLTFLRCLARVQTLKLGALKTPKVDTQLVYY